MTRFPLPLISVVYLTYMHEKFALAALQSVLTQTYPLLDIIILDDASSDGTADIITNELAKHRDRIDVRFICNDRNLGASANERKGVSLAQGDFIIPFSGDDIMSPNMVETMVTVWREADVSLVTANASFIDAAGRELNRFFHDPMKPYDETFETLARHCGNVVCFGAAMGFERTLYDKFGLPPDYLGTSDLMLPFYAYLSKGVRFIPEPLLKYRVHSQNTSLSLQYERSANQIDKLRVWEEDRYLHLAHALHMSSELDRVVQLDPTRYGDVERRIRPLLTALAFERAQQMIDARVALRTMDASRRAIFEPIQARPSIEPTSTRNPDAEAATVAIPGAGHLRAFEAGGRRVLVYLMQFKQALTGQFGISLAFDAYRRALDMPDSDHLCLKRVASLRTVAERGSPFHETAPAGERFVVEPPTVIGAGNHRALEGVARSMFVACLTDARIRGRSAFIEVDGLALLDFQGDELARIDDQLDLDPAVFQGAENHEAWIIQPKGDAASTEVEEAFALVGPWTLEFGHWMCDYLPRYVAAVASGALPPVPLVVDADLPKTHRQALELMIPKGVEIIELPAFTTARVHRLWCAPSLMYWPLLQKDNERFKWDYVALPPARFAAVIGRMVCQADRKISSGTGCERLFLARKPGLHHPLVNAAAIEAIARERGFSVVYPEDFDFAEQVRMLRHARFVVGPDGSAINFLSWFARPGTRLCILTHDYMIGLSALTGLLSAVGIDVIILTGPRAEIKEEYPEFVDYTIDEARFAAFLDCWLDGRMPPVISESLPSDRAAKAAYEAAVSKHMIEIAPELRQIEAKIDRIIATGGDAAEIQHLQTMRTILVSGLFDADLYLEQCPDVRQAEVDPLDHYVRHGDREMRMPNSVFFPFYYRRQFMKGLPESHNTLEHYIHAGEASGARPNSAFVPQAYLNANPGFAEFVDRPLFHYLKIGRAAGDEICGTRTARILNPLLEYVYAHARPDLLIEAKRSLVKGFGVAEGFAHYRQHIDRSDQAEVHLKRIASLRDFAQTHPLAAYYEKAPAGEPFVVPAPAVIGEGSPRPLEGRTRSMFVACLTDARVRAGSHIIEVSDVALLDYEGEEMARMDQQLDTDPSVFYATGDAAWIITPQDGAAVFDAAVVDIEEAFTLLGVFADHFGHGMLEYLPKYIAACLSGALPPVPLLIEADGPKWLQQALKLILPEGIDIIEIPRNATAHVRRLWCASTQQCFGTFVLYNERFKLEYFLSPPERFAPIVREMVRRVDGALPAAKGPERVFLARSPSFTRKLVNRAAIEMAAQARGFLVVYPEELDFAEQVRLTRDARFVVGPDGSAMFLAFFAKSGTKVCILSFPDALVEMPHMSGLFGAIELDVVVFTGHCARLNLEYPPCSDYEIDEAAFCGFLDQWLDEAAVSKPRCGIRAQRRPPRRSSRST